MLRFAGPTFSLLILCSIPSGAQLESLRSIALRTGGVAITHLNLDYPQWPLDRMAHSANLIVRGRITDVTPRLNEDESLVFTDYTVQPLEILKSPRALVGTSKPGPTPPVVFQQFGGTVKVDGLVLKTTTDIEDPDRPIKVGEEYFLFLNAAEAAHSLRARPNIYESVMGPLGILPVRNGKVENFTRRAAGARPLAGDDPARFAAAIRAMLVDKR